MYLGIGIDTEEELHVGGSLWTVNDATFQSQQKAFENCGKCGTRPLGDGFDGVCMKSGQKSCIAIGWVWPCSRGVKESLLPFPLSSKPPKQRWNYLCHDFSSARGDHGPHRTDTSEVHRSTKVKDAVVPVLCLFHRLSAPGIC